MSSKVGRGLWCMLVFCGSNEHPEWSGVDTLICCMIQESFNWVRALAWLSGYCVVMRGQRPVFEGSQLDIDAAQSVLLRNIESSLTQMLLERPQPYCTETPMVSHKYYL